MVMAIPMVMGANLGTTITNTIVSPGAHPGQRRVSPRLRRRHRARLLQPAGGLHLPAPGADVRSAAKECGRDCQPAAGLRRHVDEGDGFHEAPHLPVPGSHRRCRRLPAGQGGAIATILIGILLILFCVTALGKVLQQVMVGRAKELLHKALGRGPLTGIASGTLVTVMVQSSSTTTSLMIPWREAACSAPANSIPSPWGQHRHHHHRPAGRHRHQRCRCPARPDHRPGPRAVQPLRRGAHLRVPFLRELPIKAAEALARVGSENKLLALGYVAGLFFALPALMMVAVK